MELNMLSLEHVLTMHSDLLSFRQHQAEKVQLIKTRRLSTARTCESAIHCPPALLYAIFDNTSERASLKQSNNPSKQISCPTDRHKLPSGVSYASVQFRGIHLPPFCWYTFPPCCYYRKYNLVCIKVPYFSTGLLDHRYQLRSLDSSNHS